MSETIRLAICVASSGQCRTFFASSLAGLIGAVQSFNWWPQVESVETTLFVAESSVIHGNRESLIHRSLDWGATHILFLDDDMVFEPQVLLSLFGRRHDIVLVNYPKRGFPLAPTAVAIDQRPMLPKPGGIEEADYGGFGFALISAEVFRKVPAPWFLPIWSEEQNCYTTEDLPFYRKAREHGYRVWVDHDAGWLVAHAGVHHFRWERPSNGQ